MKDIFHSRELEARRFFIPIVLPRFSSDMMRSIFYYSKVIAFNYYSLRGYPKIFKEASSKGIRDTFSIPEDKKILLLTTEHDHKIDKFLKGKGIEEFKKDVENFSPDAFMSPDLWAYDEDGEEKNYKMVNWAIELANSCNDIEGMIPNIHGVSFSHQNLFVEHFKEMGYRTFIRPGREYLINTKNRKRDELRLSSFVDYLTKKHGIKIIVTGCSSPRQHKIVNEAIGFAGLGYYINAMKRRLLVNGKSMYVFDKKFRCERGICCKAIPGKMLAEKKYDVNRVVHQLVEINESLKEKTIFVQKSLWWS